MLGNGSLGNGSLQDGLELNASHSHRLFVYYSEAVVEPTILAVGTLTNIISVLVLWGSKIPLNLRICIISLTLSDLFASLTGFCNILVEIVYLDGDVKHGYYSTAGVVSYALYFIFMMFLCISASIVILLAVIRCCLVLHPVTTRQFLTPLRTKLLCLFTALSVVLLFLPTCMNVLWQSCYDEDPLHPVCSRHHDNLVKLGKIANAYLYMLLTLFGPVLVLVYVACFVAIHITLRKSRDIMTMLTERSASCTSERGAQRRQSITARVTKTLLAILVLDVICTLPTVVQGIGLVVAPKLTVFNKASSAQDVFDVIAEMFLDMRPAYNFWLYAFTHKEFQHRGWEILWIMQKRCRCFLLGLIKAPSNEDVSSRTQSTLVHEYACPTPSSPSGKQNLRVMLNKNGTKTHLEKTLANCSPSEGTPIVKPGRNITPI